MNYELITGRGFMNSDVDSLPAKNLQFMHYFVLVRSRFISVKLRYYVGYVFAWSVWYNNLNT